MSIDKSKVKQTVAWAGSRLREPSTYAGLAAVLLFFHIGDATTWAQALTSIGIGIGGVLAILIPEAS